MNTVFILGAGFSKRYGGPLLREMLDQSIIANRKSGREWRRFGEDKDARHQFVRGILSLMSFFLGIVTLIVVLFAPSAADRRTMS